MGARELLGPPLLHRGRRMTPTRSSQELAAAAKAAEERDKAFAELAARQRAAGDRLAEKPGNYDWLRKFEQIGKRAA